MTNGKIKSVPLDQAVFQLFAFGATVRATYNFTKIEVVKSGDDVALAYIDIVGAKENARVSLEELNKALRLL